MHGVLGNSGQTEFQPTGSSGADLMRPLRGVLCIISLASLVAFFVLTACAVAQPARPVVKIGLVGPFEGQYRYVGYDAMYAARLALREANASGGAGGYSVELVAFDDRGTVPGVRTAARNLTLDPRVVAVIGHFRDETTEAARALYSEAGLPLVVAGTVEGEVDLQTAQVCHLLDRLKRVLAREEPGVFQSADVGEPEAFRVQLMADNEDELPCADGFSLTVSAQVPPAADVDAVILFQDPVTAAETVQALRDTGWGGITAGGPTLGSPLFAQIVDPTGVIFVSPYRWPDVEGSDAVFAASYRSIGPHVPNPGPFALTTYEATQTLLATIEEASLGGKELTRQTLASDLSQSPLTATFIYRWTPTSTLELIEHTPTRD